MLTLPFSFNLPIFLSLSLFQVIILGLVIFYLLALSFFVLKTFLFVKILFGQGKKDDLKSVLSEQMAKMGELKVDFSELQKRVESLEKSTPFHIQKVGTMRFNPFDDTGGDQSFVVALLDGNNNGVVISSMHGRERTRIYCKPVKEGKESDYPLSIEEKEAIQKAQDITTR